MIPETETLFEDFLMDYNEFNTCFSLHFLWQKEKEQSAVRLHGALP